MTSRDIRERRGTMNDRQQMQSLPDAGPPFRPGDEVAFSPAEIASPDDPGWFWWEYAVIDDVTAAAQTFGGHYLSKSEDRFAQDMNNIVRHTTTYYRWREAMERALATGTENSDPEQQELRLMVLAEHPIHGGSEYPSPAVAARRASAARDIRAR
jgi:hypothetical protein